MKHRIDNPKNQFTIRLVNVAKAFGCTTIGQLEEQLLRLPESTNRIGYYPFNKKMLLREIKDFKNFSGCGGKWVVFK